MNVIYHAVLDYDTSMLHILYIYMLCQDYEGREKDITIMPWKGHISFISALFSIMKVYPTLKFPTYFSPLVY